MKIILASQSPRRKALLSEAGFSFDIHVPDTGEIDDGACPCHIPLINAMRKAAAVAELYPGSLVIGADTIVEFNGAVIGKPRDLDDARRILKTLSAGCHRVITGVALYNRSLSLETRFSEESKVWFKELGDTVIDEYLNRVHVLDKAGSYNINECGELLVSRTEGPYDNIIGLPCARLARAIHAALSLSDCGGR